MTEAHGRLTEVLGLAVSRAGADLEEVALERAGSRQVVRLVVDRDGGISLDDLAEASRAASAALDELDQEEPHLLSAAYVLEVSSPGVDRPLLLPRHWQRNIGRLVTVSLREGPALTGRVLRADGDGLLLDVAGTTQPLAFADVIRGQVQVEFTHPTSPGEAP